MSVFTRVGRIAILASLLSAPLVAQAPAAPSPANPAGAADDRAFFDRAREARRLGSATAPVRMLEFFDYACPDCGRYHATRADSVRRAFAESGEVELVPTAWPIPGLLRSWQAAEGAACAGAVGGAPVFTKVHDRLLREQAQWSVLVDARAHIEGIVADAGANRTAYAECVASDRVAPLLNTDIRLGNALGVNGTPTLVLLRRDASDLSQVVVLSAFAPLDSIRAALNRVRGAR
jgi:protein-disulfide isomerase